MSSNVASRLPAGLPKNLPRALERAHSVLDQLVDDPEQLRQLYDDERIFIDHARMGEWPPPEGEEAEDGIRYACPAELIDHIIDALAGGCRDPEILGPALQIFGRVPCGVTVELSLLIVHALATATFGQEGNEGPISARAVAATIAGEEETLRSLLGKVDSDLIPARRVGRLLTTWLERSGEVADGLLSGFLGSLAATEAAEGGSEAEPAGVPGAVSSEQVTADVPDVQPAAPGPSTESGLAAEAALEPEPQPAASATESVQDAEPDVAPSAPNDRAGMPESPPDPAPEASAATPPPEEEGEPESILAPEAEDAGEAPPVPWWTIDGARLTAPLSGDDPGGEDLDLGTDIVTLEELENILGVGDKQSIHETDTKLRGLCQSILKDRSRDLRVVRIYGRALILQSGVAGLTDAVQLLAAMIDDLGLEKIHKRCAERLLEKRRRKGLATCIEKWATDLKAWADLVGREEVPEKALQEAARAAPHLTKALEYGDRAIARAFESHGFATPPRFDQCAEAYRGDFFRRLPGFLELVRQAQEAVDAAEVEAAATPEEGAPGAVEAHGESPAQVEESTVEEANGAAPPPPQREEKKAIWEFVHQDWEPLANPFDGEDPAGEDLVEAPDDPLEKSSELARKRRDSAEEVDVTEEVKLLVTVLQKRAVDLSCASRLAQALSYKHGVTGLLDGIHLLTKVCDSVGRIGHEPYPRHRKPDKRADRWAKVLRDALEQMALALRSWVARHHDGGTDVEATARALKAVGPSLKLFGERSREWLSDYRADVDIVVLAVNEVRGLDAVQSAQSRADEAARATEESALREAAAAQTAAAPATTQAPTGSPAAPGPAVGASAGGHPTMSSNPAERFDQLLGWGRDLFMGSQQTDLFGLFVMLTASWGIGTRGQTRPIPTGGWPQPSSETSDKLHAILARVSKKGGIHVLEAQSDAGGVVAILIQGLQKGEPWMVGSNLWGYALGIGVASHPMPGIQGLSQTVRAAAALRWDQINGAQGFAPPLPGNDEAAAHRVTVQKNMIEWFEGCAEGLRGGGAGGGDVGGDGDGDGVASLVGEADKHVKKGEFSKAWEETEGACASERASPRRRFLALLSVAELIQAVKPDIALNFYRNLRGELDDTRIRRWEGTGLEARVLEGLVRSGGKVQQPRAQKVAAEALDDLFALDPTRGATVSADFPTLPPP